MLSIRTDGTKIRPGRTGRQFYGRRSLGGTRFNTKVAGTVRVPSANAGVFKGYGAWKVAATF